MPQSKLKASYIREVYRRLHACFGPQHWWPADSPFEVIVGAILTQNTSWSNVEKAIAALKQEKLLQPKKLFILDTHKLAQVIRPCGYYNLKAQRLKAFLKFLFQNFRGSLPRLFSLPTPRLREQLLQVKGIGPETADSIILYAAEKPVFVVDAYTLRFLRRHKLIAEKAAYLEVQSLFERSLPRSAELFNEYHALIVRLGKKFCRKNPLCQRCPLKKTFQAKR
ncbi:MAG: endonuclease III domain-containing protein [Candidatus Omnitrophota bacterium]